MAKKTRRFPSWKDAEDAHNTEVLERGILEMAVRELVMGKVDWIQGALIRARRRVGVCQLGRAHGGIVIIQEHGVVSVKYLESWVNQALLLHAPDTRHKYMEEYRSWEDIQYLARSVNKMVLEFNERKAREAIGCVRSPQVPVVDQDIRTY